MTTYQTQWQPKTTEAEKSLWDKISVPFEWWKRNVEVPGAAIITAPWSPELSPQISESWLSKQRREYEAWEAPKFVKGATELGVTLPLAFIPIGGIVGKVAKVAGLARGAKVISEIEPTAKAVEPLIQKLMGALKVAKKATRETEALRSAERTKRAMTAVEAVRKGETYEEASRLLGGELPKSAFESVAKQFTDDEIMSFKNIIKTSPKLDHPNPQMDFYNRLSTTKGFNDVMMGIIPQQSKLELLERVFGSGLIKSILAKRSLGQKAFQTALDIAGLPRAILASFDMSGILRQGGILFARDPLMGIGASKQMMRAAFSGKNADLIFENMTKRPYFDKLMEYAPNVITPLPGKVGTVLKAMEEPFMTHFANLIPGIKQSNRAYVTVLNEMRSRFWGKLYPAWEKLGAIEADFRALGNFIGQATGRGTFPKFLGQTSPLLNATLFSPRLLFSRFQLPTNLFSSSPFVRREAIRTFLSFGGFGVGILSALKLTGAKIELDPRSSDFGKAKIGNTRLDFWAGYSQLAKFTAQFVTGERKAVATGRIQDLPRGDIIRMFFQSKMSPAVGLVNDIIAGHTYIGEEMKLDTETVKAQMFQRLMPLFIQDLIDAIQTDGITGGLTALPGVLGVGVTTYIPGQTPLTKELNIKRDEITRQRYGMTWDELGSQRGKLYQLQLQNETPELQALLDRVQQEKVDRGNASGGEWNDFYNQRAKAKTDYLSKLNAAQTAYDNGEITGYDFKKIATAAGSVLDGIYGHIETQFPKIMEYLAQPGSKEAENQLAIGDVALEEYMSLMFGNDLEDEMGQYNFEEAEIRRNFFISQWGQDVYDYVQQTLAAGRNIPPLMSDLYKAREVLRPYWQVADKVRELFGERFAESNRGQSLITKRRQQMRKLDPVMEQYYQQFYKQV